MHWPDPAPILAGLELPTGMTARPLARDDLAAVCAWLAAHDPQIAVGDAAELLEPDFYAREVALAGEDQAISERPSFAVVLTAGDAVAGCLVLEYELAEQALFRRLAAAAPEHARHWLDAEERFGRALGANVVYGFVALDDRARCALLVRAGRVLCGVLPSSDRALIPGLGVRHVPRAIYAKLLIADHELRWPARDALRPATAALMALLFDQPASAAPSAAAALPAGAPVAAAWPVAATVPPATAAAPLAAIPTTGGLATAWPDLAPIVAALRLPASVTLRQLARGDLAQLVERLPAWYFQIATTAQRRLLTAAFYDDCVALAGEDQTIARRPIHARVFVHRGELIGLTYSICEVKRSTLRAEFIVIDPRHRGLGLALATLPFKVLLARAIGVDTVLAMATLRDPYRQMAAERSGFRLAGLLPAAGIDDAGDGAKHVFEAMYACSLVPAERAFRPPAAAMLPRVAAVADFVLGAPSPAGAPHPPHPSQPDEPGEPHERQ